MDYVAEAVLQDNIAEALVERTHLIIALLAVVQAAAQVQVRAVALRAVVQAAAQVQVLRLNVQESLVKAHVFHVMKKQAHVSMTALGRYVVKNLVLAHMIPLNVQKQHVLLLVVLVITASMGNVFINVVDGYVV